MQAIAAIIRKLLFCIWGMLRNDEYRDGKHLCRRSKSFRGHLLKKGVVKNGESLFLYIAYE